MGRISCPFHASIVNSCICLFKMYVFIYKQEIVDFIHMVLKARLVQPVQFDCQLVF